MVTIEMFKEYHYHECEKNPYINSFWDSKSEALFNALLGLKLVFDGDILAGYIATHWDNIIDIELSSDEYCNPLDFDRWFTFTANDGNHYRVFEEIHHGDSGVFFPCQTPILGREEEDEN